ncbi:SepZ/EspZ family type III secretion system protein [Escherichia coli]|uniref:SepZ/EspZ family type III secretion system protein n=1 Tax=Escherichia coli TaxID=562 RepID=UPI0010782EAC|nr:SepZ/EspZ family type III secretion system protein [Escherichia coli]EEC7197636.1 type III secretion system protein SepZ [Escherichia coli]EFA3074505.1 type III secretion system protein SepZ [Escherichia coli]EFG4325221.1 type III secretion system protein SepZ [Escherichia coli]MBB8479763.1 type III secretion system protein SepZ [Escherichia coli]GCQ57903.1 T3SS secreted effector EspZ [Escherichia coli]
MEAANLSPSGPVLPLAVTINGNNPVDEMTGVMQSEGGTSRSVRILGGVLIGAGVLAAISTGIAAMCVDDSSQRLRLGLGIAAGVLGGVTTVASGLAMKYA